MRDLDSENKKSSPRKVRGAPVAWPAYAKRSGGQARLTRGAPAGKRGALQRKKKPSLRRLSGERPAYARRSGGQAGHFFKEKKAFIKKAFG